MSTILALALNHFFSFGTKSIIQLLKLSFVRYIYSSIDENFQSMKRIHQLKPIKDQKQVPRPPCCKGWSGHWSRCQMSPRHRRRADQAVS